MTTKTAKTAMTRPVMKLSSLKSDRVREEQGAWMDALDLPGVRFNVSSLHKPAFVTARDLLYQRLAKTYRKTPIPPHVLSTEMGKLYHQHILHDWDGLDEAYSSDLALSILTDPAYRIVVASIESCAARVSETDIEFVEVAAGN